MRKILFIFIVLSANSLFALAQTSPQTRTATLLNYNLDGVAVTNYPTNTVASSVEGDDGIYASTNKLSKQKSSLLVLQGFQFDIPVDATIENITVKARRFKTGKGEVKDLHVQLVTRRAQLPEWWERYGVSWVNPNYFPAIESEVNYSQTGSGVIVRGGVSIPYQWTPAKINDLYFGIELQSFIPTEIKGASLVVRYDLVEITVEFSMPVAASRQSKGNVETKPVKAPVIYSNPFITKTNIQFTASENGKAIVELYNISGARIRTLFSRNVMQGQVYNASFGDLLLPKGIYVYTINNGKQMQSGRIIKLE